VSLRLGSTRQRERGARDVAVVAGELHADIEGRVLDLVIVVVPAQLLVLVEHMVDGIRIDFAGEIAALKGVRDPGLLDGEPGHRITFHVEEQRAEVVIILWGNEGDVEAQVVADLRDDDLDIPMAIGSGPVLVLIPSRNKCLRCHGSP